MDVIETIDQIETDFTEGNGPFEDITFPEERLIEELKVQSGRSDEPIHFSAEEIASAVSMFAMFDYNRDANQLVDNLLELHDEKPNWFDAYSVPTSEKAAELEFEEIGFRYPNRDAHAFVENNRILREKYSGNWTELILESGCNATDLVEQLREDGFLYVKGAKIAPMYARIISEHVAELDELWLLEIPVDTHIARLTQDLTDAEMGNDEIRAWWGTVGARNDISRHVVDGALWQIGNNWDQWGKEYWERVNSDNSDDE